MAGLREILEEVTSGWVDATNESFTNHPLAIKFRNNLSDVVKSIVSTRYPQFIVKSSVGAGNWASVPWVSILNPEITTTTQDGIYPVYLFKADGSGVYLSLNQGTTIPREKLGVPKAASYADQIKLKIITQAPSLKSWGQSDINLVSHTALGRSYESPNISAKYYDSKNFPSEEILVSDLLSLLDIYAYLKMDGEASEMEIEREESEITDSVYLNISKPFLILAGISGTGKSRFVRKQAEASGSIDTNYKLISVRPDWHEPSDLLGYISRIKKEKYIVTDALKFMVSAWCDACDLGNTSEKVLANKAPSEMNTFWLCLDEMNLAPVEQYFADYLSVIETRKWNEEVYSCDAILKADVIKLLESTAATNLRNDLGLSDTKYDSLWSYFSEIGIPLPPNLIVAGTVNMDETTHGFSRKVIDRALTLDFGQFFPNDFDAFFEPTSNPVIFSFPTLSQATKSDFNDVAADSEGKNSLEFLKGINDILKGTMFELAYRALNELFISVICNKPKNDIELQAVWDDFLMTKVLPRIEGDDDKLKIHNDSNNKEILKALDEYIKQKLPLIYETELRPDFFRIDKESNKPVEIKCRSRAKLKWMSDRLANNGFTTFWP